MGDETGIEFVAGLQLDWMRQCYEETRCGLFVLQAVDLCFGKNIPPPEWVKLSFMDCYQRVVPSDYSLNQAFNCQHEERKHVKKATKRAARQQPVFLYAAALRASGAKLDNDLWRKVGGKYHIGSRSASKLYYSELALVSSYPAWLRLSLQKKAFDLARTEIPLSREELLKVAQSLHEIFRETTGTSMAGGAPGYVIRLISAEELTKYP